MKSIVIDANVFHAFYYETMRGERFPERTSSAIPIFDGLGQQWIGFLDDGSQIETEWRNLSRGAEEWFNNWLANAYQEGHLYEIEPSKDVGLKKRYQQAGFPLTKDVWYLRVAYELACICKRDRPCLIAEDIDFYDPAKKAHAKKSDIFRLGKGAVSKVLEKDGVDIRCIETFCDDFLARQ